MKYLLSICLLLFTAIFAVAQTYSTKYIYTNNNGKAFFENRLTDIETAINKTAGQGYKVVGVGTAVINNGFGQFTNLFIVQKPDVQPASYFQNLATEVRTNTDAAVKLEIANAKTELADQLNKIAANSLNDQNRQFLIDYINHSLDKRLANIRQAIIDSIATHK